MKEHQVTSLPVSKGVTLANLLTQKINLLDILETAASQGDIVRVLMMRQSAYFLNTPDAIKHVLVDNHRNYHKGRGLQAARGLIGNGLLTSEDDLHTRQRRMIQPSFHRRRIATYADVMTAHTQAQIATWRAGDQPDLHEELMTLTMGIVAQCLFDVDVRHDAPELSAALEGVFDNLSMLDSSPLGQLLTKLPLPRTQRRRDHMSVLDAAIHEFIEQRRNNPAERDDLLSMLLLARDEEGDHMGMSDQQVRDEVMTLFLAGHETTANALSWAFYLLTQNPSVETKLVEELTRVLGDRPPTMNDLAALPYNKMVLSEAMRLYPPAYVMGRQALADDEIAGHVIPAGATVLMSQYTMHRHPRHWDDPLQFMPERFDKDSPAHSQRPRYAYFPFGGGARMCIGEPFAWMEGELLLATILQRYHFTLQAGAVIEPEPLITLRLKHGLPVTIHPR